MSEDADCIHCGTPFQKTVTESEFCCSGCRFVHDLLQGEGLEQFYSLRGDTPGRPVKERPFQKAETDWLRSLIDERPQDEEQHSLTLRISGVTCIGCVWLIEKLYLRLPGAVRVAVHPATAEAEFTWAAESDALIEIAQELPRFGYVLENPDSVTQRSRESHALLPRLGISAALALNTMAFSLPHYLGMESSFAYASLFALIALVSSTFTLLLGGSYFFKKAFTALQQRTVHIDLPIALGLGCAYMGSIIGWLAGDVRLVYFDFVAMFTTLMLGGRYLHLAATERAQNQLQGQSAILPSVTLIDGTEIPTARLKAGDQFTLSAAQTLPVTAVLSGQSTDFSLAWMTGEPDPQTFPTGQRVPAGAVVLGNSAVQLTADEPWEASLVNHLTQENTERKRSRTDIILKYYLISIIIIGASAGLFKLWQGQPILDALQTTISIFVISCPCAIGVAIPLVDRRASSAMAKIGVFVQNPRIWNQLRQIRNIVFDKTGTLTLEHPQLSNPELLSHLNDAARKALATLTSQSLHPLSRALHQQLYTSAGESESVTEHPGLGSRSHIDGHTWTLGKPGWRGGSVMSEVMSEQTSCELARDGESIAIFTFDETLRPHTANALKRLQSTHRFAFHIFSGDRKGRIQQFAKRLSIPEEHAHGDLSPESKASRVEKLPQSLYLGDGMNDTLAFDASTLTGTPVADRSLLDRRADFLFTCSGLGFLPTLFSIAHWRYHTVSQVFVFTVLYNICAVTACIMGQMTPLLAAVLMPVSSLISLALASRSLPRSTERKPSTSQAQARSTRQPMKTNGPNQVAVISAE